MVGAWTQAASRVKRQATGFRREGQTQIGGLVSGMGRGAGGGPRVYDTRAGPPQTCKRALVVAWIALGSPEGCLLVVSVSAVKVQSQRLAALTTSTLVSLPNAYTDRTRSPLSKARFERSPFPFRRPLTAHTSSAS